MEFCLFKWFYRAEGHAVLMRFKHDPLASCPVEPEYPGKDLYDMLHAVHSVVVKKDPESWNVRNVLFKDGSGFGGRRNSHNCGDGCFSDGKLFQEHGKMVEQRNVLVKRQRIFYRRIFCPKAEIIRSVVLRGSPG
jgi:hypothetical protein